ncbi:heavy metal translocating P-type ATPase [Mycobacterium cookii]|uniref:Cation-transporting P-type ATPase B n=1 Tax=Mycobacterium cookii TaxID=1775 RepID=A0A7I7L2X1_9MYCO|nr:heavy metal translocating P-type ATPase [Mycobacterium cookii]MCV7329810.1 cadmium-translocating P-type ATPase [Mycobacterium cookii]BBX47952.1 putative metal transporter ATPase [Mycobacterium cookii]
MTTTDLDLRGMSCASCAARVEGALNRLDGVRAAVNFALERAHVQHGSAVSAGDLIRAVESTGYRASVARSGLPDDLSDHRLRTRLVGSALLAIPVVAVSMLMGWQFAGWQWLALVLATPIVAWGGLPFHVAAARALRRGSSTMDTLVSLGTLAAYLWSATAVLRGTGPVYFEVAAAVTVFQLAGRYAEARAKRASGAALRSLLSLGAKDAAVLRDGDEVRVPVSQLRVDDVVVVRPGERVAADGVIVDGATALDTSAMTGEPMPIDVSAGDTVTGGSLNTYGRLLVRAVRVGDDTQLARMAKLVSDAQNGKAPIQRTADRVAAIFVPAVLVIAALTMAGWVMAGQPASSAFTAAVAVLIIACPCALGLATPTAILVGTGRGAQLGILIKDPRVLETIDRVDTVVFDKTGTLTTGAMAVREVQPQPGEDADVVLARAAAVESASEHPVAAAIVSAALDRGVKLSAVEGFVNEPGTGVAGVVDGVEVAVSRAGSLAGVDLLAPPARQTAVQVTWGGQLRGVITLADQIKPGSAAAIAELKAMGITPMLLTGDSFAVAEQVAAAVGIDSADVIAGVLPTGKADVVQQLQARGRTVAMVGDGVNDSVALAVSDIGMAMGSGADVAIDAGDLTLMRADVHAVPTALRLSARTLRTIRMNLFWAFAYNAAAIPLAAAGLLNPMISGAAMACSSLLVVANSLRLKQFQDANQASSPGSC